MFPACTLGGAPEAPRPCIERAALERTVDSYFRILSGPAGLQRDAGSFDLLFLPTARIDAVGIDAAGNNQLFPQSVDEFIDHVNGYVRERGFIQSDGDREIHCTGRLASVVTRFESRNEPGGALIDRGSMRFHLLHDDGRWRIAHVMWQSAPR